MSKQPKTPLDRCLLYLAKMPDAISGSGGHDKTIAAACICYQFGLDEGDAWAALQSFNGRCKPPWTEKELRHKLADARKLVDKDRTFAKFLRDNPAESQVKRSVPRLAPKTEKPKQPYPTPEAAQAGALWQAQQVAREKKLDPGKICFAGSWPYPGDRRVLRFDLGAMDEATGKMAKTFRPIYRNGKNWFVGDPPGLWPLYHRDELPADGPVYVCEGEKATDAARSVGLCAVTSAHGCKAADKTDWRPLAGREIIILPDNDDDGRKYAEKVAAILTALGCTVRVVNLFEADHGA